MIEASQPNTHDAVVVIPGIMGSALRDRESGEELWSLRTPGWFASAWTTGSSLHRLAVTDAERSGDARRVEPVGLLEMPAWAPVLRGVEPYRKLLATARQITAHPGAVIPFPYDWRLSIRHSAERLAEAAIPHLEAWQRHSKGSRDARLVLVAHSMGGLVARWFTHVLGHRDLVRQTITLATPYYGSVKATVLFNTGRGTPVPLPSARLRAAARTMPGLHDLLPSYRCLDRGTTGDHLSAADVKTLGGDEELAREARDRHDALMTGDAGRLRLLVGTSQRTQQSLSLANGIVTPLETELDVDADGTVRGRIDRRGDETVYRRAASAFGLEATPLPQSHSAVAATTEALAFVADAVLNRESRPPLAGKAELGVAVPDSHVLGTELPVEISGGNVVGTRCAVFEAETNRLVRVLPLQRRGDGVLTGRVDLRRSGLYRVEAKTGGCSAVITHVMALPSDTPMVEDDS